MGVNDFSEFTFASQECPSGVVNEEKFQNIYSQFFPQGGELSAPEAMKISDCVHNAFIHTILSFFIHFINFEKKLYITSVFDSVEVHMYLFIITAKLT